MVVPPPFLASSVDLLAGYYSLLGREFAKDIYILNIPRPVGRLLPANELEQLLNLKEVAGICDVSGSGIVRQRLYKTKKHKLHFEGHAPSLLDSSLWGINGFMTVTLGLFPGLLLAFWRYITAGDLQKAREGQDIITRLSSLIHLPGRPVCVGAKYVLYLEGMYKPSVMPPLEEPTEAEKLHIKKEYAALKDEISGY